MDRDSLHAHVRSLLGDLLAVRYTSEQLDHAIRRALSTLSLSVPLVLEQTLTLAVSGVDCDLSALPGLTQVLSVVYPWDAMDAVPISLRDWLFYWNSGLPALRRTRGVFEAGEQVRICYCALHTVDGLDGAETTTVPDTLLGLLGLGAAGQAAMLRAAAFLEAHGSLASDQDQLRTLGQTWWGGFTEALTTQRCFQSLPQDPFPRVGFALEG